MFVFDDFFWEDDPQRLTNGWRESIRQVAGGMEMQPIQPTWNIPSGSGNLA